MAKPRTYKTEAVVLKRIDLGEADSIVILYTPNLGKVRAVARGVRKLKSKLGGHLDLLTRTALLMSQGQTLDVISQGQTIESFFRLKSDLKQISCALYMAELVDQFTVEQVENYPVYNLLLTDLNWLSEAPDSDIVLRHFELHLLGHLGYRPELYNCLECKTPLTPQKNLFSAAGGGIICPSCAGSETAVRYVSVDALKVMRFLLNNDRVLAGRLRINSEVSREVEQLLRWYIRYILDREVKSLRFLDSLR